MDRNILNLKGFSLLELSIVMGVTALLATAVMPIAVRSIEIKAGEKAVTEVALIQAAAVKFYNDQKVWPVDLAQLQSQGYLSPLWSLLNPWANPYEVSSTSNTFSVSTQVPPNLVSMLAFRLPQSSVDGNTVTSVIGAASKDSSTAGIIVAWSGTISAIPSGWALCDGNNGTPDLRDKFIVGAAQDVNGAAKTNITGTLLQTGGKSTHDHGAQTGPHALTIAQMPSHHFDIMINDATSSGGPVRYPETVAVTRLKPYSTNTLGGDQPHTHPISLDSNVPPFYALAFIMKLS